MEKRTNKGLKYTGRLKTKRGEVVARDVLLTMRFTPAERDKLHEFARARGLSVSALIRHLLERESVPLPPPDAQDRRETTERGAAPAAPSSVPTIALAQSPQGALKVEIRGSEGAAIVETKRSLSEVLAFLVGGS